MRESLLVASGNVEYEVIQEVNAYAIVGRDDWPDTALWLALTSCSCVWQRFAQVYYPLSPPVLLTSPPVCHPSNPVSDHSNDRDFSTSILFNVA